MPEKCTSPLYFLVVEQGAADALLFIHIYSLSISVYGPEYGPVYMDLNELSVATSLSFQTRA